MPVRRLPHPYLKGYLILEVCINNEKEFDMSPSQTVDEFDSFIINLEKLVVDISSRNPYFALITGDFHAISTDSSVNDTTTSEGAQLHFFMIMCGLKQLTAESIHILKNSSSCIDLIFTNQLNLVMDSGMYLNLHSKCHH